MKKEIKNVHVLVVEDHELLSKILIQALTRAGIDKIALATNGLEALNIIQSGTPVNLIICDLDMPTMDGIEFINHVGTHGSDVSIIISSSLDPALIRTVEDMAASHGLDVLGTLPKPISSEKLEGFINRYLQQDILTENSQPQHTGLAINQAILEKAIDDGQFILYFQPKVKLDTGELHSVEALARWKHPNASIVAPGQFIAQMEQWGLIEKLTLSLLNQALDQIENWKKQGRSISVAINISPAMLNNTQLPDILLKEISSRHLDPKLLILEITENGAITNTTSTLTTLARLKMHGFSLAIDDFGVGYSSMQQLNRIPFTELKIDRSFVHNASNDTTLKAIIEANLSLAQNLGLKTVAEGIEQSKDWQLLRDLHCEMAQGFFIGKPMPASELDDWEKSWLEFTTSNRFPKR
ncbi:EAL domain-containing response regulator [Endozoicomonas sp. Mp262]|uniref:EAL domain-containing response regulator n=1 Tax=Endozoicomonas sp. Mp262 TaxID=2919499 RepID=UPI0021D9C710